MKIKEKLQNRFDKNDNYRQIINKIENNTKTKNTLIFKPITIICSVIIVCVLSIGIVFADEIKEIISSWSYKYTPTENGGQHIITVDGKIEISKDSTFTTFGYKSINEIEKNLEIRILKSKMIPDTYIGLYVYKNEANGKYVDYEDKNPTGILIEISNYNDKECWFNSHSYECKNMHTKKKLDLTINFLTQYSTNETIENSKIVFNDFSNSEPDVEIIHIDSLDTDVYVNGYPEREYNLFELAFVYDNIIYHFQGYGYTNEEIIEMIKSMHY